MKDDSQLTDNELDDYFTDEIDFLPKRWYGLYPTQWGLLIMILGGLGSLTATALAIRCLINH